MNPACTKHPDRRGMWLSKDGGWRCDECQRPWNELAKRQHHERRELEIRHAAEREEMKTTHGRV